MADLCFPEFSPTQRIPGPIRATVFDNPDSVYDIILGMDTLQVLEFDISCSTKTVTFNGNTIPFRPKNYFDQVNFLSSLNAISQQDPLDTDTTFLPSLPVEAEGYKAKVILPSNS